VLTGGRRHARRNQRRHGAGDLVNTASRQSVAPPGAVLVGEAVRRA
jgi:class 3 adenylate cyclase